MGKANSRASIAKVVITSALIIVIVSGGVVSYLLFFNQNRSFGNTRSSTSVTSCYVNNSCFVEEPVGDVIIPKLSNSLGSNEVSNNVLNMTRGESLSLAVLVYPTINVNVTMELQLFPPVESNVSATVTTSAYSSSNASSSSSAYGSNENSSIAAKFNPIGMHIKAYGNSTTIMALSVSKDAIVGTYSAVVSAVDAENSSIVWGASFEINVQP